MKRSLIARALTAAALAALPAFSAAAQVTQPTPSYPEPYPGPLPYPYDLHNNNRAIAFGSPQLVAGGSDITTWQAVDTYGYCFTGESDSGSSTLPEAIGAEPISRLDPDPANPTDPIDPTDPTDPVPPACYWAVMVTTHYELFVCPNGRAYILRSGDGVSLETRTTGSLFSWSEGMGCEDGPGLVATSGNAVDGRDAKRPLDFSRMRFARK